MFETVMLTKAKGSLFIQLLKNILKGTEGTPMDCGIWDQDIHALKDSAQMKALPW